MSYTEIFKLKEMLEEAKIPFIFKNRSFKIDSWIREDYQIEYPDTYGKGRVCSVVEGVGTYGNEQDLLEIMGLLTPEEEKENGVAGWLTAEDVFDRVKEHFESKKVRYNNAT